MNSKVALLYMIKINSLMKCLLPRFLKQPIWEIKNIIIKCWRKSSKRKTNTSTISRHSWRTSNETKTPEMMVNKGLLSFLVP